MLKNRLLGTAQQNDLNLPKEPETREFKSDMKSNPLGFSYLGTLDDVVNRYPWRFKMDEARMNQSLVLQLVTGRPVLLNDGYIVNNEVLRRQLRNKDSLFWHLIHEGFIYIYSRGAGKYGIHEMPERMAHIGSFSDLIKGRVPGVDWPKLREDLEDLHARVERKAGYVAWAPYDTASGYEAFAKRLLESTARSAGLGNLTNTQVFRDFLNRFIDGQEASGRGPRDRWETLAKSYANEPDYTSQPKQLVNAMMRLANEIYHYNVGVGLSATLPVPISIETQASSAFDDLLVEENVLVEDPQGLRDLPRLRISNSVSKVPPAELMKILRPGKLSDARIAWLRASEELAKVAASHYSGYSAREHGVRQSLKSLGDAYIAELKQAFGPHIDVKLSEGLFDVVIDKLEELVGEHKQAAVNTFVATATGLASGAAMKMTGSEAVTSAVAATAGAGASIASAYGLAKFKNATTSTLVRKYRLFMADKITPIAAIENSRRQIEKIKRRKLPMNMEISREASLSITSQMRKVT